MPQSIAQTTRCTRIAPSLSSTDTSATCATKLPNDSCTATPRARPCGSGVPQPDFSAARFKHAEVARMVLQQRAPVLDRILAGGVRQFVDQALHHEARCGCGRPSATTAPGCRCCGECSVDAMVGDVLQVRRVGDALDRGRVDAVLHHHRLERRAGEDRLPDEHVVPRDRHAVRVQRRCAPGARTSAGSSRRARRPRASTRS